MQVGRHGVHKTMITLTREEAQQVLDALECMNEGAFNTEIKLLRARLSAPEPEPVAWMNESDIGRTDWKVWAHGKPTATMPLYFAPPQREWQGLTEEEIMSLLPGAVRLPPGWSDTVQAIEAKLREKNAPDL